MEIEDLVDILLPIYNTNEQYLKEQINSLLNQTHKQIKIYISDDFSADTSIFKILNEYKINDSRIELFRQNKNIGYIKNFEFLLQQSKANYIMFCDHDDIWHEDKVKKSLEKIKESDCSLVYCNCKQIDNNGKLIKSNYFKNKSIPLIRGTSKLAISRYAGLGCSQIFTKEIKEKMIPFTPKVMAHDWLAGFIANERKGIDYIYDELFDYRLHMSNVFGGRNLNQNLNRWKAKKGNTYCSYKEYRKDTIDKAYLDGAKMCLEYAEKKENKEFIIKLIKYYKKIKKTTIINLHFMQFFRLLGGKNLGKKMCKELILFHFPLLGFIFFKSR